VRAPVCGLGNARQADRFGLRSAAALALVLSLAPHIARVSRPRAWPCAPGGQEAEVSAWRRRRNM
jgi:hypothetical protein